MFILGLTGSLGMGKSTTARFFAEEGIPVHDADATVHRLYEGEAAPLIEAAFPGTTRDGKVDRARLAERVLADPAAIRKLESIVHPMVAAARDRFLAEAERNGAKIVVLDVPLLYETGGDGQCDAVVVVSAPAQTQRARVMERPGMSEDKLAAILAQQVPDAEKRARADFIVDTGHGFEAARRQVREIIAQVSMLANRKAARGRT